MCVCDLFETCLKISRVCPREYFENSFERKYLMLFEGFEKYLVSVLENILKIVFEIVKWGVKSICF